MEKNESDNVNFNFSFKPPQKFLDFAASKKLVKFIGLLFMVIGLPMAIMALKIHIDEKDALTWTPHVALIKSAKIGTHIDADNGFKSYSVVVAYQYKWGNTLYEGDQYRLHDNAYSGFDENNEIVQELLVASRQREDYPIFVNPNKPNVSAIKNAVNGESKLVATAFGIIFPMIGFFMFFFPHKFNKNMPQ